MALHERKHDDVDDDDDDEDFDPAGHDMSDDDDDDSAGTEDGQCSCKRATEWVCAGGIYRVCCPHKQLMLSLSIWREECGLL